MKLIWIALPVCAGLLSTVGNLLIKQSRLSPAFDGLVGIVLNPWFLAAGAFYGVNLLLFAKSLDSLPVSIAYPILAGVGFASLVVASAILFGERIDTAKIAGIFLILAGVIVLSLRETTK